MIRQKPRTGINFWGGQQTQRQTTAAAAASSSMNNITAAAAANAPNTQMVLSSIFVRNSTVNSGGAASTITAAAANLAANATSTINISSMKHLPSNNFTIVTSSIPVSVAASNNVSLISSNDRGGSQFLKRSTSGVQLDKLELPERLVVQKELFNEAGGWLSAQREKASQYNTQAAQAQHRSSTSSLNKLSLPTPSNNSNGQLKMKPILMFQHSMNSLMSQNSLALLSDRRATAASNSGCGSSLGGANAIDGSMRKPIFYERKKIYSLKHFIPLAAGMSGGGSSNYPSKYDSAYSESTQNEEQNILPPPTERIISSAHRKALVRDFDQKVQRFIKSMMIKQRGMSKEQHRMYKHVEASMEEINQSLRVQKNLSSSNSIHLSSGEPLLIVHRRVSVSQLADRPLPPLRGPRSSSHIENRSDLQQQSPRKPSQVKKTYYQLNEQQMEVMPREQVQLLSEEEKSKYLFALEQFKLAGNQFSVSVAPSSHRASSRNQQSRRTETHGGGDAAAAEQSSCLQDSDMKQDRLSNNRLHRYGSSVESKKSLLLQNVTNRAGDFPHSSLQEMMIQRFGSFLASETTDYDEKLRLMRTQYEKMLENFESRSFRIVLPSNMKPRGQDFNDFYVIEQKKNGGKEEKEYVKYVNPQLAEFEDIIDAEFKGFTETLTLLQKQAVEEEEEKDETARRSNEINEEVEEVEDDEEGKRVPSLTRKQSKAPSMIARQINSEDEANATAAVHLAVTEEHQSDSEDEGRGVSMRRLAVKKEVMKELEEEEMSVVVTVKPEVAAKIVEEVEIVQPPPPPSSHPSKKVKEEGKVKTKKKERKKERRALSIQQSTEKVVEQIVLLPVEMMLLGTGVLNELLNSEDLLDFDTSNFIANEPFRGVCFDEKVHHETPEDEAAFKRIAVWEVLIEEENVDHDFWRVSLQKRTTQNYWPQKLAAILDHQDAAAALQVDVVAEMSGDSRANIPEAAVAAAGSPLRLQKMTSIQDQDSFCSSPRKKTHVAFMSSSPSKQPQPKSLFKINVLPEETDQMIDGEGQTTAAAEGNINEDSDESDADSQASSSKEYSLLNLDNVNVLQTIPSVSDLTITLSR